MSRWDRMLLKNQVKVEEKVKKKTFSTFTFAFTFAFTFFFGAEYAFGLERWIVGEEGKAWNQVIEQKDSRNVEETPEGWLQPEQVDSTRNLSLGVQDRGGWYTGHGANLIWSGSIHWGFDDDPNTAAIVLDSRARITVDFGAAYPINRVRFYPRPKFPLRFIPGFDLYVNDGTLPPDLTGMDMWILARETYRGSTYNKIDWQFLYERRENLEHVVDLDFPRQYVRYIQIGDFERATWEIAEFEVYGEGYVREGRYVSQVIDLGGAADFGKVAWSVEMDPGAEVVLRSRSGTTSDPFLYYRLTGIGPTGQTRIKDENGNGTAWDEYNRLRDDQGDVVLDTEHWSFWSPPYPIEVGEEPMISPGPRRYVQFQLDFKAGDSFDDGVRVRSLSLEYSKPPLAQQVVGEIAPATVHPGEVTTFTYALSGTFGPGQMGFDAFEISTPVQIDALSVRNVTIGGMPADITLEVREDRFVLYLPTRVKSSDDVVMLNFDCAVFVPGTSFTGTVFDRKGTEASQRIVPGDASPEIDSNDLSVSWSLEGKLLGAVTVTPALLTPNGDGANDATKISYGVLQLLRPVRVSVQIYDLCGLLVWEKREQCTSGPNSVTWEAVHQNGDHVPPGVYIYRVSVNAAEGDDIRSGLITVVY